MRIYFKLNVDLHGYKAGTIISTPACSAGIPLAKKWRKRFAEKDNDGCLSVLKKPGKQLKNKAITG